MLGIVGTVPDKDFPLISGRVRLEKERIHIGETTVPVNRGTPALLAAAAMACKVLGLAPPMGYLVGDTGLGRGSRLLYDHLVHSIGRSGLRFVTFHYLQPDVDWHNKVLFALADISHPPLLIADAGFMYAAKMSGQSKAYELFTPDAGELAFLADEEAPHPFYTRGFILHNEDQVPELISRAYEHENAARYLLVKGRQDHVASNKGVHAVIDSPADEALEAMGGTGDSLTGIVSALIASGIKTKEAAILAAGINRLAGHYARPTPASQVMEVIGHIPRAMEEVLDKGGKRIEPVHSEPEIA